ncbi:MAG: ATP-binding protein [Polyangiales bacterium]
MGEVRFEFDLEQIPREALIRELRMRREVEARMHATGARDAERLLRELFVQQIELETQNRELLESQLALEESRARYAALYNEAPVGIVTFDAGGLIKELNLTAARLLGGPREQLVGVPFSTLVAAPDRRRFWTHLRRCLSEERSITTELSLALRGRSPSVQLVGATAPDSGGMSCRTSLVDISELKQSEARLRLLSDAGQKLACSLDYRSTLGAVVRLAAPVFADACLLDVVGEGGAVERIEVVAADPAAQLELEVMMRRPTARGAGHAPQRAVIASGRSALFEQRPMARAGAESETSSLWDALAATSMLVVPVSARGHTLGALTFVTARARRRFQQSDVPFAEELARRAAMAIDNALLYDQAQRAVHARENLLAIVSHDLQSPLSAILMRVDVLRARGETALGDHVEAIGRAALGMNGLIDDLLDLASIDAGNLSMRLEPLPLAVLVDDALAQLGPRAEQRGIALARSLPTTPLAVRGDRIRLMQVLTNLIGNALKFTPLGGTVTVSAQRHDAEVRVAVADTGCGITGAQLPHIFDRYWQADPRARAGAGLGLSICKAIVEAHGARIWAESGAGDGATLYFTLPYVAT